MSGCRAEFPFVSRGGDRDRYGTDLDHQGAMAVSVRRGHIEHRRQGIVLATTVP